ncbi:hypothetical protein Agub_g11348, partial [Astrephomene gubernaculifera]
QRSVGGGAGGVAGGGGAKGEKTGKMSRDEFEVFSVLDKVVERVSVVMAEPDEKEREKMLKAMEKQDRAAARRREKAAAEKAEKAAAAAAGGGAAEGAATGAAGAGAAAVAAGAAVPGSEKVTKAAKAAAKQAAKAAKEAAAAEAAAAAAADAAASQPPPPSSNQVDERSLPSAREPPPPAVLLELSYGAAAAGGAGGAGSAAAPGPDTGAVAAPDVKQEGEGGAVLLGCDEVQRLLGVYQFLWDHRELLGLEGRVPSLADLLLLLSHPPARLPPTARRAADDLHLSLLRLLVGEAVSELIDYTAQTSTLPRRELSPASPPLTPATWPEVARRYLAAAAAARYLTSSEPRSSALAQLQLPGQLQNLEPADWLHHLLAGFNFPHLLSRIALLPHASS